jgi:hypothetical protein
MVETQNRKRATIKIPVNRDSTGGIYTEEENTQLKRGNTSARVT